MHACMYMQTHKHIRPRGFVQCVYAYFYVGTVDYDHLSLYMYVCIYV
jgi:hypothetical protein